MLTFESASIFQIGIAVNLSLFQLSSARGQPNYELRTVLFPNYEL
jgi:hypothetical protein